MANFIKEWTNHEIERLTRSFRRHSRFISGLKFILPLAIAGMIAALLIYPQSDENKGSKIVLVAQDQKEEAKKEAPEMINPRFHGVDSSNQPYQVTAKHAVQKGEGEILMEDVNADMVMNNGDFIAVVADGGTYNTKQEYVQLTGDVQVYLTTHESQIYEIKTDSAYVDIASQTITGDSAITVDSNMGEFSAGGFVVRKAEDRINFKGPVKLVILRE